jgi:uncharacterized protein (DUF3084 family)
MENNEIVKIQARVPSSLWAQLEPFRFKSQNEAVNYAFEKLIGQKNINQSELRINQNEPIINQNEPTINQNEPIINQMHVRLEEKESQIKEIRVQNEILIQNMNNQIELLSSQLSKKDEQIEKQSYHIQSLIQENSKLNIKLLPESTKAKELKKPWWRFW